MNTALWWAGQNTITVAVMIPFVAVACRLFRHRPAVRHALWVVVLLKFVTPPVVSWPWTAAEVREALWQAPATPSPAAPDALVVPVGGEFLTSEAAEDGRTDGALSPYENLDSPDFVQVALGVAAGVWLAGAGFCALRQARRVARHAALVRRGTAAPEALTAEIRAAARQLGLRPPPADVVRGIPSPFLWCLGRLRLIWPEALASRDAISRARGAIAHELAHARRGDHWVSWLELAAGVVWWWNPLFWYVRGRLREAAEMACDALAISACPEGRREYAELFLELSSGFKSGAPAPFLAVSAGAPSSFERRLSMILSDRVSGKVSWTGCLAAVGFALAALPGWSAGQQKSPPDSPEVPALQKAAKYAAGDAAGDDELRARLKVMEAELQRLNKLLEQRNTPAPAGPKGGASDWTGAFFKGNGRAYWLASHEKGGALIALNGADGRVIWSHQFGGPIPAAVAGDWTLEEPKDVKQVVLTWHGKDGRLNKYAFDTNSGKLLAKGGAPSPAGGNVPADAADLARAVKAAYDADYRRAHAREQDASDKAVRQGLDYLKRVQGAPEPTADAAGNRAAARAGGDPPSPLDLAERYLKAVAELKKARSRLSRMPAGGGPVSQQEIEEAQIEGERAEKMVRLLEDYLKDAVKAARAAALAARDELRRAELLLQRGAMAQGERDAAKARADEAETRLRQLESIAPVTARPGQ